MDNENKNPWEPEIKRFTYEHAIVWAYPEERRQSIRDVRGSWVDQLEEHTGYLVFIPNPFGMNIVVSAFDGETQYTVQTTGGHFGHMVITKQIVDAPIEVESSEWKASTQEDYEALMNSWYEWMPYGLRKVVKGLLNVEKQV